MSEPPRGARAATPPGAACSATLQPGVTCSAQLQGAAAPAPEAQSGRRRRRDRPPGVTALSTEAIAPASTFVLTETGSFQKGGFKLTAKGIAERPGVRGDFSSLTLDQLEPLTPLGAGASGTVRLARHTPSGKLLALKAINVMGEKGNRHQMLNELRLLCSLEHACLVPLFDAFYLDGHVYLALG